MKKVDLLKYSAGYWGYMCDNVRYTISQAVASVTADNGETLGNYLQMLDDGYNTVAVNSLAVGIHGMENLGGMVCPFLSTYADEAAAATAGLVAGQFYKTASGELRVKL